MQRLFKNNAAIARRAISLRCYSSKTDLTTPPTIPIAFGKKLFKLFEQSKYDEVVNQIDSSPYRADINLKKLKSESLKFSILEQQDELTRTDFQIKFMEENKIKPFPIETDAETVTLKKETDLRT